MNGSIIDADATLFEVGRRLRYLSQARRRNCHRKGRKMSTPSLQKGWRARGQRQGGKEGSRARLTGIMKRLYCIILNVHIRTHKCFQNIVFCGSLLLALLILSLNVCIYTYKAIHHTRTDTHTFSIYVCLSFLRVRDRERGGFTVSNTHTHSEQSITHILVCLGGVKVFFDIVTK